MNQLRPLALALIMTTAGASSAQPVKDPVIASQLASSWEVLWHQSGMPTRVARWHQPIRMKIVGLPVDDALIDKALVEVTSIAGLELIHSGTAANLVVEVVADKELEDAEPCVTVMALDPDTFEIGKVAIRMRQSEVGRCIYHEALHAMGLRGHPSGETTLSYFTQVHDQLQPLDRVMLRAWYSKAMKTGMSPIDAMPVLADEIVCAAPDRINARLLRDSFMDMVLGDMRRYVAGEGDVPSIVKRSGKTTSYGLSKSRNAMALFLDSARNSFKKFSELQCKSAVTYSAR